METTTQELTQVEIPTEVRRDMDEVEGILQECTALTINSNEQYNNAGETLKAVKRRYKQLEEHRTAMTKPMNTALKAANDLFRRPKEVLVKAEGVLKGSMMVYQREVDRKRREEEARLAEIARREEEKRRKQLEAKAEKSESKGRVEQAEAYRDIAETVHVPVKEATQAAPKVKGVSTKKVWKWRIVDEAKIPRNLFTLNEVQISKMVRASGAHTNIPGIEAYQEETMAVR